MSLTKVSYSMIEGAPVNVLDFGAVGDGTTNDTAAIQAAVNAALASGASLYVPAGSYLLTSQINVNLYDAAVARGLIIFGDGWRSLFIVNHTGTGFYINCNPSFGFYQAQLVNLTFTSGTNHPAKIVHNVGAINTLIDNCVFENATATYCVYNDNAYGLTLRGCIFARVTGTGVFYAYTASLSTYSYVNSVEGCDFSTITTGISAQGCDALLLSNTVFEECTSGVVINPVPTQVNAFNITIDTCWFERNTTVDIDFQSSSSYWCEGTIRNTQFAGFDPTYQAHINLGVKSKVSIEGTPAGNTVFVSGSSGASAILFKAANFVQSGTFNWTVIDSQGNIASNTLTTPGAAIDISGNVTGLTYKSLTGTYGAPASGSAVTLTTLPTTTVGVWLVTAAVSVSNVAGTAVSLVTTQAGTSAATALKTGSQISISTSGLDLQATQTTGIVYSIVWTITRLS